jgi:glycosyltransferase involved in cell wall biosynthesis
VAAAAAEGGDRVTAPDVALISPFPPSGWTGVASYSSRLAAALRRAGARVTVIADVLDGAPPVVRSGGLEVRRVWRRGPGALPRAAAGAVRTGAPAVHLQHELMLYGGAAAAPGVLPALAALRAARRRTVVTMHHVLDAGAIDAGFTATHRVHAPVPVARAGVAGLQRGIRTLADAVVVHEPEFASLLPGAEVIPHGIDAPADPSRAAARAALGLRDDRLVALCFGFLAPYKGLEVALEGVSKTGDDVQLVLAGGDHPRVGGEYAARLRDAAPPGTRFTGFVPDEDVARWFKAADVLLALYPRPFATSGPLALALAHGTPVLLSPRLAALTGAPAELSVELEPLAVARRLRTLAERPEERARLRERVAALAAGRSWPEVARRHLEVYA